MTNSKDLIRSIKQLKNFGAAGAPSGNFVNRNKEILMMQIKNSSAEKEQVLSIKTIWRMTEAVMPEHLFKFAVKPALLAVLVFGIAFGGWAATVSASYDSLPGDTLYTLKIMTEKAQLALTPEDAKPSLQMELASRRLEEMIKIANEEASESQGVRTQEAVDNFTKQVQEVKTTLENLQTQDDAPKALEVAQIVDRKTAEYSSILADAKETVPTEARENIAVAANVVNDTSIKAVEVIVKTTNDSATGTDRQDVTTKVEEKIKMVEEQVSQMSSTSTINGTIAQEAKDGLTEARQALSNDNLTTVVDKLVEVKNLVNNAIGETNSTSTVN